MRLILIFIFLSFVISAIAQDRVITTSNDTIYCDIESFVGTDLKFKENVFSIGGKYLNIWEVKQIAGEMPSSRRKAIWKRNPEIKIGTLDGVGNFFDMSYTKTESMSTGDLIKISSGLRLTGLTLATGITLLNWTDAFENMELKDIKTLNIVTYATSLAFFISGEIVLMQAGNRMNQEAVTITPAESGLGLALNF